MLRRSLHRRFITAIILAGLFGPTGIVAGASAQQSGYSTWTDPAAPSADTRLQSFVERLNKLVDDAEKARAADPNFLRDLRELATGFNRPWRKRVFSDDFVDGDYTRDPAWAVTSGKYWVERGWGLRSAVKPGAAAGATGGASQKLTREQRAAQIFGAILNQALGGNKGGNKDSQTQPLTPAPATDAIAHAEASISNAFSL